MKEWLYELAVGSGDEASLSIGNMLGNWGGGSFTWDFEGKVQKRALETGISLHRGPLGNGGSPLTGNFKR
jgi:hypothetical protein